MTTSVKRILSTVALLLFCFCPGLASPPSGSVGFTFSSPTALLFDLTGSYDIDQEIKGTDDSTVDLTIYGLQIEQDGQGRLRAVNGRGAIFVGIGPDLVVADYSASGRITGGGNSPTHVRLQVHLRGDDIVGGVETAFQISIQYDLEIVDGALSGTAHGSAHFAKLSGGTIDSSVSISLPGVMDGSWTLTLDVVPLSRIGGSGTIFLSNGRILQGHLNGVYSANLARSKVRLNGTVQQTILLPVPVALSGNRLDVIIPDDPAAPVQINGNLLGQTVME